MLKTQKKSKQEIKNKWNEQKMASKMIYHDPNISIITLNVKWSKYNS